MFRNLQPGCVGIQADWQRALELAQLGGFEGVDLPVQQAAEWQAAGKMDQVQEAMSAAKLRWGGFGMPFHFTADEETYRAGLDALPRLAAAAQEMGVSRTYTWVPPASDELEFDANFQFHVDRLRPIAEVLRDHGIRFGLEFIGPKTLRTGKRFEFIHTLDGMLELCEAIGTGNCGLLLDCWHWYTSEGGVEDLRRLKPMDIVYVHVNDAPVGVSVDQQIDNVRCLPGDTGVIDIVGFLTALQAVGYDGPVTPEPFNKGLNAMDDEDAARTVGAAMQKIWRAAGL